MHRRHRPRCTDAAAPASADLLTVVPGGFENTGGGFQGPAPLRFPGSGGSRTQQVVRIAAVHEFRRTAADHGDRPAHLSRGRPSLFFGNAVTASNIFINLSTTQCGDEGNALSANFANNIGGDQPEVYSGGADAHDRGERQHAA